MKHKISAFFIMMLLSLAIHAKTVYVTDQTNHMLRNGGTNQSKIINMLPPGTALNVLSENPQTGYMLVRTKRGIEGYILATNTLTRPSNAWFLKKERQKLKSLQKNYELLTEELNQIKKNNKNTLSSNESLSQGYEKLSKKFSDLREASSNAVEVKLQRDKLQARVIAVERELQQVKHEKQILEGNSNQDWFIYGGILTLISVMLGYLLSKLNWQRRSKQWDTF